MTDVRFMELHTELFHAGKNFGKKLEPRKTEGLKLQWDGTKKWFEITYKGRMGYILASNAAFWEPEQETPAEVITNQHRTEDIAGRRNAQVSTPMGHVFEGPGKGKKNDRAGTKDI